MFCSSSSCVLFIVLWSCIYEIWIRLSIAANDYFDHKQHVHLLVFFELQSCMKQEMGVSSMLLGITSTSFCFAIDLICAHITRSKFHIPLPRYNY